MKKLIILLIALLIPMFVLAQQPNRMTDDQMKKVWESVDQGAGKFRDAVGGKVQKITMESGESFDIQQMTKDFDSSAEKLKDAFSSGKESNADVEAFLKQASTIDGLVNKSSSLASAKSSWDALRKELDKLVDAYNVTWTWDQNSPHPHRMGDRAVEGLLIRMKESSKQVRDDVNDSLKKDSSVDKATREKVENSFKAMEKKAEELGNRVKDNKPVSSEVTELLSIGKDLKTILDPLKLSQKASSGWISMKDMFTSLGKAYRVPSE